MRAAKNEMEKIPPRRDTKGLFGKDRRILMRVFKTENRTRESSGGKKLIPGW
jgi:hypothetical protein